MTSRPSHADDRVGTQAILGRAPLRVQMFDELSAHGRHRVPSWPAARESTGDQLHLAPAGPARVIEEDQSPARPGAGGASPGPIRWTATRCCCSDDPGRSPGRPARPSEWNRGRSERLLHLAVHPQLAGAWSGELDLTVHLR